MVVTSLEEALRAPKQVTALALERQKLKAVSPRVGKLVALEELSLAGNEMSLLPDEIGDLPRLRVLNVSRNRLTRLPASFARLHALQELRLDVNQLRELPNLSRLSRLRVLEIGPNPPLTRVPDWVWELGSLERLGLFRVPLGRIPPDIARLASLRSLDIGEPGELLAHDREPPAAVWTLKSLRALSVFGTSLRAIPPSIAALAQLQELSVVNGRLATLPAEISKLTNLRKLVLDGNRLKRLPDEIAALGALEELSLEDNPLEPGEPERLARLLPRTKLAFGDGEE